MSNSQGDFNPKAFLTLAKKLMETQDDAAAQRTVISRSYYSAFLLTRRKLGLERSAHGNHADVWKALAGLGGANCLLQASHGQNLRLLRNKADYGNTINRLADEAKKALRTAEQIIQGIAGVEKPGR